MRHLLMLLADRARDEGGPPARKAADALQAYGRELVRAGVLLAGEALAPAAEGARVELGDGRGDVAVGALGASTESIAAFWLLETTGMDEALEWARRFPLPGATVEVRRVRDRNKPGRPVAALCG